MSKNVELKELIILLLMLTINVGISYIITFALGIQNHILFTSYTAFGTTISYETIIFLTLSLITSFIYDYKTKQIKE